MKLTPKPFTRVELGGWVLVISVLLIAVPSSFADASTNSTDVLKPRNWSSGRVQLAQLEAGNTTVPTDNRTPTDAAGPPITDARTDVGDAEAVGSSRRETLLASLTIFLLAVFLGFEIITKVPPTLHTPLMSGSNAISGITLVGALLVAGTTSSGWMTPFLGFLAVVMATINAVGGFAVTHRMLSMFRRK